MIKLKEEEKFVYYNYSVLYGLYRHGFNRMTRDWKLLTSMFLIAKHTSSVYSTYELFRLQFNFFDYRLVLIVIVINKWLT